MIDRIPTQILSNGAIRNAIYDENGTFLRYEWIKKDDEPTQAGTPINKANLLSDTTSQLIFSDSNDHTVNEALAAIQTNFDNLAKFTYGTYVGTGVYGESNKNVISFSFKPKYIIIYGPYAYSCCGLSSDAYLYSDGSDYKIVSWVKNGNNWYLYWYSRTNATAQMNQSGKTYFYMGIGEA